MKTRRGRPRLYDPDEALTAAGGIFWAQGFDGTSLDDLSEAMGMNRPSIYRAFGDKEAVYRKSLARFCEKMDAGASATLFADSDIRRGLRKFLLEAIEIYTTTPHPLGCMVMCTAPAAAVSHPDVRADLLSVIKSLDERIEARLQIAVEAEQLPKSIDPKTLSHLIQSVLHSLAIRSRAGQSKAVLRKLVDGAVGTFFPTP
ncbi:MAG: TetR/AcrR family transcriptional regulator [Pseudomonadota bacterium]